MNRFELYHDIINSSKVSSMRSLLNVALDRLIKATGSLRAAWFGVGPGGLRVLAAFEQNSVQLGTAEQLFPIELGKRAISLKQPQIADLPRGPTATTGRGVISRFLAVPVLWDTQVLGLVFLERRFQQAPFSITERDLVLFIVAGIQQLLNSSSDFERQSFEMDQMKSQMAMGRVNMVSQHPSMMNLFRLIEKLARVPATVLIHGESGTGKELVARAIFDLGNYSGPFIAINCGGIEPNLLKSELFGSLKGSFTGSAKDRPGLFKKAEDGVLFLDEIGEMPMDMQVSLLRTLECGEILPVGADQPILVNTRLVAATHQDLKGMVEKGTFRNDLYQRLKGITLDVPPLRSRKSDIAPLCEFFVRKYNQKFGLTFKGLHHDAMELLSSQTFGQGNVRELEHIIERAMVFEDDDDYISTKYLLPENPSEPDAAVTRTSFVGDGSFEDQMNQFAAQLLNETIRLNQGNKTKAMKVLGLSRSTFYGMLNRYGIELQGEKE